MLTYPQLAHFPIVKRRRLRTVVNRMADGREIRLADPKAEAVEWQLKYTELSDVEAGALQEFFLAAEGRLKSFLFVDPTANLFDHSESLGETVWWKGPLLSVSEEDGAWLLSNAGGGPQEIVQTLAAPPGFLYCLSLYARADAAQTVRLVAGDARSEQAAGPDWRRLRLTATVENPTFGVEIAAGGAVYVRGMQVEAQAGASTARRTSRGGIYEGARLRDDWIEMVATGMNRHSCTVNIVHERHF